MNIKLFITSLFILLTVACSHTPSTLIVAPDIIGNNKTTAQKKYYNKSINITVQDLRTSPHLVQIMSVTNAATLINSQSALNEIVLTTLNKEFIKQGLNISNNSENQLHVNIVNALIKVNQELVKYQTTTAIALEVKLDNGQQTLTKNFRIKGTSHGPLTPDLAVLSRDFNQQLSTVIAKVLNDSEIQQWIK